MKKLVVSAVAAVMAFGMNIGGKQVSFSVTPWGAHTIYAKSGKKSAWSGGLFATIYSYPFKAEIAADKFIQDYKDPNTSKYSETGAFLRLHYFTYLFGGSWDFSIGYKGIWRSNVESMVYTTITTYQTTNRDRWNPEEATTITTTEITTTSLAKYIYVVQLGGLYYKLGQYNAGANLYFTNYKDYKVYQVSPKVGYYLLKRDPQYGTVYGELGVDYLHITNNYAFHNNYVDLRASLHGWLGKWDTKLFTVLGKNTYRVANGGATIYDTSGEYQYDYGLEIGYQFLPNLHASLGFDRACFQEIKGEDSYSTTIYATLTASF
jgi:hypothetical protein